MGSDRNATPKDYFVVGNELPAQAKPRILAPAKFPAYLRFKGPGALFFPILGDTATFFDPNQNPEGIDYMFVNGHPVVDDGRPTGLPAGRILSR